MRRLPTLFTLGAVGLAVAAAALGCEERRKPLKLTGDLGPSVVVVDPIKRPVGALPPLPLVDETEPDDDLAHAQPIPAGQGIKGTLGAPKTVKGKRVSDEDMYSFVASGVAPDGGFLSARIELSGITGADLFLEALDGDGKRIWLANDGGVGEGEVIPNLGLQPGNTYFLRVRGLVPAEGSRPYELMVRCGPPSPGEEREPNDDVARAQTMATLADGSGFFGRRRDEDWFLLPAAPGPGTLRVELSPVEGVSPSVRLFSGKPPGLVPLAEARGGRGDELRLRNVGVPGGDQPLYLALKALEGRSVESRWRLQIAWEPPLEGAEREPNDTLALANPLSLAGQAQVSGFLWAGDADTYKVTATEDALVGAELDAVERVDLRLERLAADGRSLAKANDNGAGKAERLPPFPIAKGEEIFLRVTGRARDTAFDAPYRLTLTPGPK